MLVEIHYGAKQKWWLKIPQSYNDNDMALFSSAYFSKCFKFYHPQNYLLEKKKNFQQFKLFFNVIELSNLPP